MLIDQLAIPAEVQDRVIDRCSVWFALVDPKHDVRAGLSGGGPDAVGSSARHDDGLVDEPGEPCFITVPDRHRVDPDRRSGHEHLGEDDQASSLGGGGADQLLDLARGRLAIHRHVGRLHRRHPEGFSHAVRLRQPVGTEIPIPPRVSAPWRAISWSMSRGPIRLRASRAASSSRSAGTIHAISNSSPSGSLP